MDVILEGKGRVIIRQNDHIATGGEGVIYKSGNLVIKIYHDINKVAWNDIQGKIDFFRIHQNSYIISPLGNVTDAKGKIIGFYMPLAEGEPLVRYFTNDYRKQIGFNDDVSLVNKIRDIVVYAHGNGAIMLDANELGYMVKYTEPRVLDVDSWIINNKIPPTVAIMPSIRDWHTKGFNQSSDWFAWGIVTFQLFTGIHPYKGTLDGYKLGELERRMKDNASVFSKNIKLNRSVRDFGNIPNPLLDWYVKTFSSNDRSIPPSPTDKGVSTTGYARTLYSSITQTGSVILEKLLDIAGIIRVFPCGVVLHKDGSLIDLNTKRVLAVCSDACNLIKTVNGWLLYDGKFYYLTLSNKIELNIAIKPNHVIAYENRMFLVNGSKLTEIVLTDLGNKQLLGLGQSWNIMEYSTKWFDGIGIQDVLGSIYLTLPFSDKSCANIRVKELDGIVPISAIAGHRFVTILGMNRAGDYIKSELYLSDDYSSYKYWSAITDNPDLNISILPKGVCAIIVKDGEITIFVPSNGNINKVVDKQLIGIELYRWDNMVVGLLDEKVWKVSVK
jgi:hypothetical protein